MYLWGGCVGTYKVWALVRWIVGGGRNAYMHPLFGDWCVTEGQSIK